MIRPAPAAAPAIMLAVLLAACAGTPKKQAPPAAQADQPATPAAHLPSRSPYAPAQEDLSKRGDYVAGGLYAPHIQDSAPEGLADVELIPEPEVQAEPRSRYGNRDYSVLGKRYRVMASARGYVEQGLASYYGKKFHGRRTSSLEVYDMYTFSAAHKTLPLPSYARVTNVANGKSVVVRVNDRGPFHAGRIIDLSYAAAVKLGVDRAGVAKVEVRALEPGDVGEKAAPILAKAAPTAAAPSALDRMVAALPVASANAAEVTPGMAVATGGPSPTDPAAGLPEAATQAARAALRFDMRQDGKVMTADEFDAWMRSRQVQVATGKAGRPRASKAASPAATTPPTPTPATTVPKVAASEPASKAAAARSGVTLQVASFAGRANAERALAMLHGAGIGNARLVDAVAAGQPVWRLRVGPLEAAEATELGVRVRGLGFGPPNPVRD